MPEAVQEWTETQKLNKCAKIHQEINSTYQQDFHKYAKQHEIPHVVKVLINKNIITDCYVFFQSFFD